MWTLTAVFDGPTMDVHPPETTKLLKTNKAYPLGRKDVPLCINVKKVSRTHGTFTVAEFTEESAIDPDTRPKLEYTNTSKNLSIQRGDEIHIVNPDQSFELLDGDLVGVTSLVIMKVQWQPVCCYQPVARGKSKSLLKSCASLGIHLVHMPGQNITHHLTDSFAATTLQALSLVSATAFVKPAWLDEVIRLGNLPLNSNPSSGVSLEQNFKVPPIAKYRPTFDNTLPSEQKTLKIWEANEERMTMFSGYRFICIGEAKRQIDSELRELLTRANGRVEVFDIKGGAEKWRGTLVRSKAKAKQSLVPLADEEACTAAVGKDSWKEIVETTRIFGLRFYSNQDVIQAVLNADASLLSSSGTPDDAAPSSSPLPNIVPNTHPDEGSLVPEPEEPEPEPESEVPPPRKLTRRVSSRQASQEPAEEAPAPRRHLTRRAQPGGLPIITGLDDPSILLNNLPDTSSVAKPAAPVDPSKPRSRLKRRVGASAPGDNVETLISNAIMSGVEPETGEEPPLKKFKALFEASDPRRSGAESFVQESGAFDEDELMLMSNIGSQSQTQQETQTQGGGKRSTRSGNSAALRAVPEEEEEESQMPVDSAPAADAGKKRKERSFDGDDVEMAGVEEALKGASAGSGSGNGPAAKKRAVEGNAVERAAAATQPANVTKPAANAAAKALASTKSTGKKDAAAAGAASGKPDTDDAFLKAIASTKRGKKTEDDFDRDFNKLKISKSNLRGEETDHRPEWELLENFGDETNLRGNFMVIQDLEVFKVDGHGARKRAVGTDPRWEGKPDFKKFKKNTNNAAARKKTIELIISDENEAAGLGPAYWKGGSSPARADEDEDDFGGPTQKRQTQPKLVPSRSKAKSQTIIIDDSDEDVKPKEKAKRTTKPASKADPPKKRATRGASKAPEAPAALFLDDSDDDIKIRDEPEGMDEDDDFDGGQTLPSSAEAAGPTRRSTRPAAKKKTAPIIVDDDSDDGAVFTGFGKQKGRR